MATWLPWPWPLCGPGARGPSLPPHRFSSSRCRLWCLWLRPLLPAKGRSYFLVPTHPVHGLCSCKGQVAMSKDSKNLCGRRVHAAGPCDLDPGPACASQARPLSLFPSTASPAPKQKDPSEGWEFNFSCFLKWVVVTLESSVISLREGLIQFRAHYTSQRLWARS